MQTIDFLPPGRTPAEPAAEYYGNAPHQSISTTGKRQSKQKGPHSKIKIHEQIVAKYQNDKLQL